MTSVTRPEPSGPASDGVFARLVSELSELGFEPTLAAWHPHDTVYTATDSGVVVTVVDDEHQPHVCVSAKRGADTTWNMHWTATTPHPTQLIALYAALNDDPTAAIDGAAAAIGVHPPTSTPRASTVAG
jgi:hypothetical protein